METDQSTGEVTDLTFSPEVDQLFAALVKFQGATKAIRKGKTAKVESQKGGYSYDYADLADIIEETRPALLAAGLAVLQPTVGDERAVTVVTQVIHSSGQWMRSRFSLRPGDSRPQAIGSLITYCRRYGFGATLGIVTEADDDGAAASRTEGAGKRAGARSAPPPPQQQPPANGSRPPADRPSAELLNELVDKLRRLGWAKPHVASWLNKHAGVTALGGLTASKANEVRGLLETALEEMEREATKGGAA